MKALADETRFEIYCIVQDSPAPLSVQQIADHMNLHPNTVRPHLDKLRESGLVATEPELSGRVGRPVHLYSATPKCPAALVGDRALRILRGVIGETLSELISPYNATPDEAYNMGRAWGRQIRSSAGGMALGSHKKSKRGRPAAATRDASSRDTAEDRRSVATLSEDLDLLGFEPSVERTGDETVIFFGDCPYRDLAKAAPEIVCTVHEAICHESLIWAGEVLEAVEFYSIEAGEPCRIRLGRSGAAGGGSAGRPEIVK